MAVTELIPDIFVELSPTTFPFAVMSPAAVIAFIPVIFVEPSPAMFPFAVMSPATERAVSLSNCKVVLFHLPVIT